MLINNSYPQIRIYGEPAGKERGLFGRKLVNVYMEVPNSWTIPDAYTARLMPGNSSDSYRIHLRDRCAVWKGKLDDDDADKVSRRVERFYYRVQETFWNKYFKKGIILAYDTLSAPLLGILAYDTLSAPLLGLINRARVRVLIPWTMPHRTPEADLKDLNMGALENLTTTFYPHEPEDIDAYDTIKILCDLGSLFVVPHPVPGNSSSFPFFNDFESMRKMISWMLDDVDAK